MGPLERHVIARATNGRTLRHSLNQNAYVRHALPVIDALQDLEGVPARKIDYRYDESPTDGDANDCASLLSACYPTETNLEKLRLIVFPDGTIVRSNELRGRPLSGLFAIQMPPWGGFRRPSIPVNLN